MRDLRARLDALAARDQLRALRPTRGVDLTSNDYLGLSTHPAVRDALITALQEGTPHGGTGSRLLSGQHDAWRLLEERFAAWQHAPAALYFATGFAANTGLVASLAADDDVIVSDALNHASLIDGARLSRAERVIVPHGDVGAVESALASRPGRTAWVVIESLHSMEGDEPALLPYVEVCERHGARLIVDDAHATGLDGPLGQGHVVAAGLRERVFASVHTCGKALGQSGAFVVGSRDLIDWLVNAARPFIFSTAPAPFLAAGIHAAIDVVSTDPALRVRPRALADRLRAGLAGRVDTGRSTGPIVPLIVGTNAAALALQSHLATRGWDARAIRPPTVAEGTSRVRVVMRAPLTDAQVDSLVGDVCEAT